MGERLLTEKRLAESPTTPSKRDAGDDPCGVDTLAQEQLRNANENEPEVAKLTNRGQDVDRFGVLASRHLHTRCKIDTTGIPKSTFNNILDCLPKEPTSFVS